MQGWSLILLPFLPASSQQQAVNDGELVPYLKNYRISPEDYVMSEFREEDFINSITVENANKKLFKEHSFRLPSQLISLSLRRQTYTRQKMPANALLHSDRWR